jgi:hypothetical protein
MGILHDVLVQSEMTVFRTMRGGCGFLRCSGWRNAARLNQCFRFEGGGAWDMPSFCRCLAVMPEAQWNEGEVRSIWQRREGGDKQTAQK